MSFGGALGTVVLVLVSWGAAAAETDPATEAATGPGRQTGSAARKRALTVALHGRAAMEFVWIGAGRFTMGSPDLEAGRSSDEGPQHEVTINEGFYLGRYEVTQGQWKAVMGTRPWYKQRHVLAGGEYPAVYVSWRDAESFVRTLNEAAGTELYRLPTEAEWEYACRAGSTTCWSFGDDREALGEHAWYADNTWHAGRHYPQKVGTRQPNGWGLFDMHGNVHEWCLDGYGPYAADAQGDVRATSPGRSRVCRGGDFGEPARHTRSARRNMLDLDGRYPLVGFRIVRRAM